MIHWHDLDKGEKLAAVRTRWMAGESALEIANLFCGATRNAVIGVVCRAGLQRRLGPVTIGGGKPRATPKPIGKPAVVFARPGSAFSLEPKPPSEPQPSTALRGSSPKPWMQRLSGECTWPVDGEGADMRSCCEPVTAGSWCAEHNDRGHAPPRPGSPKNAKELERSLRRFVA